MLGRKGTVRARSGLLVTALGLSLALAVGARSAAAQDTPSGEPVAEPSAQQRQAAAEAYDRATAAYLSRDYVAAARWFETAHRMAPAAPALLQAVRAHQRAGDALRAANLALRLLAQYADDRQSVRVATPLVSAATRAYVRIDVSCAACTTELDGTLQEWPSFFVEADADHAIGAHFETGDAVPQTVRGAAGDTRAIAFDAPPAPEPEPAATGPRGWPTAALRRNTGGEVTEARDADAERPEDRARGGLPPAVFIASAGATLVAGGFLAWSGLDTAAGVPAYEANPTQEALDAGQRKELRTNVLIGVTAALGAVTGVLALLTDWGGRTDDAPDSPRVEAAVAPAPGGAVGVVRGRF